MKRSTKNKNDNFAKEENEHPFKDMFLQIARSFFGNLFEQLKDQVSEKAQDILYEIKRTITITFLILFGVVFLFIGLANIIDVVVGFRGIGYLFIGFVIMFIGFFMNIITKRR